MATKIEWAQQIKAAGLELPENWGKLSTSRAEAVKDKLLGTAKPSLGHTIGRTAGAIIGAVLGMGAAAVEVAGDVRQAVGLEPGHQLVAVGLALGEEVQHEHRQHPLEELRVARGRGHGQKLYQLLGIAN